MQHSYEETQLRMFSGVAKIKLAETPQAFPTKKSFVAMDRNVRDQT